MTQNVFVQYGDKRKEIFVNRAFFRCCCHEISLGTELGIDTSMAKERNENLETSVHVLLHLQKFNFTLFRWHTIQNINNIRKYEERQKKNNYVDQLSRLK